MNNAAVIVYHGSAPAIDSSDHLDGSLDRLSRKGAFGYEYFGDVPARRWSITKLDLLVAQAIGYTLQPTSAFVPLDDRYDRSSARHAARILLQTLAATGGIPFYEWTVSAARRD